MIRTKTLLIACTVVALASCTSSGAPAAPPAPESAGEMQMPTSTPEAAPTASEHTFTDEQADRGRDVFRASCTECHYSSEFSDSQFQFKWSRRSAGSLYQLIQTSMPETAPGSLSPEETVDLVSYILRMNGFEPGAAELAADRAVLDEVSLSSIRN